MGLIAKARTASRTAPRAVPLRPSRTPLDTQLEVDHLVRSAAAAVGARGGWSNTRRGRTSALAGVFGAGDVDSTTWFERTSSTSWEVVRGADTLGGQMADWQVDVDITTDGSLLVSTPQSLTVDGALDHGKEHDLVRAMVAGVVAGERQAEHRDQETVSGRGVVRPVAALYTDPPAQLDEHAVLTTSMSVSDVERRLRYVPEVLLERGQGSWCWGLGIERPGIATARVTVVDRGTRRALQIATTYRRGGASAAVDGSTYWLMKNFTPSLAGVLLLSGGDVEREDAQ